MKNRILLFIIIKLFVISIFSCSSKNVLFLTDPVFKRIVEEIPKGSKSYKDYKALKSIWVLEDIDFNFDNDKVDLLINKNKTDVLIVSPFFKDQISDFSQRTNISILSWGEKIRTKSNNEIMIKTDYLDVYRDIGLKASDILENLGDDSICYAVFSNETQNDRDYIKAFESAFLDQNEKSRLEMKKLAHKSSVSSIIPWIKVEANQKGVFIYSLSYGAKQLLSEINKKENITTLFLNHGEERLLELNKEVYFIDTNWFGPVLEFIKSEVDNFDGNIVAKGELIRLKK